MSTTTVSATTHLAWGGGVSSTPPRRSRRRWALAAVGVLLTAGCAAVGLVGWSAAGATTDLLVAARPIPAGHVLEAGDMRPVAVGAGEGVSAVPAAAASRLLGRPANIPVPAGALIPADLVDGTAGVLPPAGSVVLAKAVRPGVVPPLAAPGSQVRILPAPSETQAGVVSPAPEPAGAGWSAVLLSVEPAASGGDAVISLQVAEADAAPLVAAGSQVAVVVLAPAR